MDFENKIIYQIYPKSFLDTNDDGIGDIQGIIQKLDYIKELGADYIWLCPIMKSPQRDNGYDIADYYTIDPMFGTNDDYKELILKAKQKGLKIIMDLVLNHTSTEHEWFKKALNGDRKYQDYYVFRDTPTKLKSVFGGDAWEYVPNLNKYYLHMFDVTQADLNWDNPNLREELYAMINYWIKEGVEGFRLDVIDMIGKNVDTNEISRTSKFYTYLEELHDRTFADKILTVGECWGADIKDATHMCNEHGLTQVFHFEDMSLTNGPTKWIQNDLSLTALAHVLRKWNNEYDGINAWVLGNHDSPRTISKWFHNPSYREACSKLLITLYAFLRGNIYIYQGDEIGMSNYVKYDPDDYNDVETINYYKECMQDGLDEAKTKARIAKVSRDNARMPMQWNSNKNAGFSKVTPWLKVNSNYGLVNVDLDLHKEDSIYKYYQKAIWFKKTYASLIDSEMSIDLKNNVLILSKEKIKGYFNFSEESTLIGEAEGERLLSNYDSASEYIRPYECLILKTEE